MNLKTKLNDLLANDKTGEAIDLLIDKIKNTDQDIYNTLILLKARFVGNEKENNMGIISRSDYQRTKAQITYSFQQTVDRVSKNIIDSSIDKNHDHILNTENISTPREFEGNQQMLDLLIEKKIFLEKELITTYDGEKKFALQQNINGLKEQIQNIKNSVEVTEIKTNHEIENVQPPKEKRKIRIFVSYSSRDRELRELLVEGLRQHLYQSIGYEFELWTDRQIDIGDDWKSVIESALTKSDAALLLVSASFAASGFINREELAGFFKLKKESRFLIMPVLVRDYDFGQFEMLSSLNFFKTYNSEYGFTKPIEKHKLLPFDKLAENEHATDAQLNSYYKNLADYIRNAVSNAFH